jgi:hypothetical protein
MMNINRIFETMNRHGVRYLLIGGMNFMLRHAPMILTYDVDLWIDDVAINWQNCELALAELNAQWGKTDESWKHVKEMQPGWLEQQSMFCLTTEHGAVDIFRSVAGLDNWQSSWDRGISGALSTGTAYRALSDEDMLRCQMALPEGLQKKSRIETLRAQIIQKGRDS